MALNREEIVHLYRQRAKHYDREMWFFRLAGLRMDHFRRLTVEALRLKKGDSVVDLGCGTGLNLPFLRRAVGPEGKILGVDLSESMLELARSRVREQGWSNVVLQQEDLSRFHPPFELNGALSTFALTLVPEYDRVIEVIAEYLKPGSCLALFDLKRPEGWPQWLVRVVAWLNKPFGVSLDLADRHPWESLRRHLGEVQLQPAYFGAVYLAVGEKTAGSTPLKR